MSVSLTDCVLTKKGLNKNIIVVWVKLSNTNDVGPVGTQRKAGKRREHKSRWSNESRQWDTADNNQGEKEDADMEGITENSKFNKQTKKQRKKTRLRKYDPKSFQQHNKNQQNLQYA